MATMKIVEIMADSHKSWEDATRQGVSKASQSIKNIRSAWIKDQSVSVEDGSVTRYRVTLKLSFEVS